MARALIALGANLGDRAATLRAALDHLAAETGITLVSASRWHETVPSGGPTGQPGYLNGAALFETTLHPEEFFARLVQSEDRFGRKRHERWGPRTLDLDLLLYDIVTMRSQTLELPHPRLAVRRFVLEPAAEIASAMMHPRTGWSIDRLLQHLSTAKPYVALTGLPGAGKTELARNVARMTGADVVTLAEGRGSPVVRSGSPQQVELEFVRARCERLADCEWANRGAWLISDFWLEQSLAYGRVELSPASQFAVSEAVAVARAVVVAPKLTVLLELVAGDSGTPPGPAPQATAAAARVALDQLASELSNALNRPDLGPVLRLDGLNLNEATRELASALETMR
jgi:2-amino-4-hydroxy-6-hydroxymethyldihydropteridine diphosphokinase